MNRQYSTLLNIPVDILFNLLRKKIQRMPKSGLIIESLKSIFITTPDAALHGLLFAFGNAKYIQVIILSYSFEDYQKTLLIEEETVKKKKVQSGK